MKSEKGFTLVEMLVVLFIIAILILVMLPNIAQHFKMIDDKGCKAHVSMVQTQVEAYRIDHMDYPTIDQLITNQYITKEQEKCPDKKTLIEIKDGQVYRVE